MMTESLSGPLDNFGEWKNLNIVVRLMEVDIVYFREVSLLCTGG
jgi:hypothetical protein